MIHLGLVLQVPLSDYSDIILCTHFTHVLHSFNICKHVIADISLHISQMLQINNCLEDDGRENEVNDAGSLRKTDSCDTYPTALKGRKCGGNNDGMR